MAIPTTPVTAADAETSNGMGKRYLVPFVLVTSLFFLWGLANILNSALIAHFQPLFNISRSMALLVETAFYFGYFLVAIPAGLFMEKKGYKTGIIFGLLLYATGALLFIPAAEYLTFGFFLGALFIIASGLAFLETAANPYVTILGKPKTAVQRLNLSQSFNGLALILGPVLASQLIFAGNEGELLSQASKQKAADAVIVPYIGIAVVVLFVAVLFFLTKMPEPAKSGKLRFDRSIFGHRHLTLGIIAQFFYVGAQASIWGISIDYVIHLLPGVSREVASGTYLAAGTFLFVAGRFIGTFLMSYLKEQLLLWISGLLAFIFCLFAIYAGGHMAVYAVLGLNFFMSIMFPTIFALGVKDLGEDTKLGSSFLIMAIVGGAALPPIVGAVSDTAGIQTCFWIPAVCFLVVMYYGLSGYKIKEART